MCATRRSPRERETGIEGEERRKGRGRSTRKGSEGAREGKGEGKGDPNTYGENGRRCRPCAPYLGREVVAVQLFRVLRRVPDYPRKQWWVAHHSFLGWFAAASFGRSASSHELESARRSAALAAAAVGCRPGIPCVAGQAFRALPQGNAAGR